MAMATIPAAAVLILLPHQMSVVATGAAKVNLADPRGSLDRAPANTFARRMRCAHFNAIEAVRAFHFLTNNMYFEIMTDTSPIVSVSAYFCWHPRLRLDKSTPRDS